MTHHLGRGVVRLAAPAVAALLAVASAAPALADWKDPVVGASPLNHTATKNVTTSDLTTIDGVPYVAWNEDTTSGGGSSSTIRVARLAADGTSWQEVAGGGLNPISRLSSTSSENPSIAAVGGRPWVAWEEGLTASNSEIRVARLNAAGTAWEEVPDALRPVNHLRESPGGQAGTPTLLSDGGSRPYVSFSENDPGSGSMFFGSDRDPAKVWVMRLDEAGTGWEQVGDGPVNPLPGLDAAFPRMTLVDGVPWVTYFQLLSVDGGSPVIGVLVSRLGQDGSWEQVGDPVVAGSPGGFDDPTIATVGGRPYVAMSAQEADPNPRIRVYSLDDAGTAWTAVGTASPADANAASPSLADIGGEPWVSWRQRSGGVSGVGTAALRDGAWQSIGTPHRFGSSGDVRDGPVLADVNGIPWYSYAEWDGTSPGGPGVEACCQQLRVSRLEPVLSGPVGQPTSDRATLLTSVEDYGLPFGVGFQYGPDDSLGTMTTLTDPLRSLFFQVVGGLTPSTVYGYRPVAVAGTPAPLVTGPRSYFVTNPAEEPARLVVAVVRAPELVRRHQVARVRFLTTQPGVATLQARQGDRPVGRPMTMDADAGTATFRWPATVQPGRYRLVVRVRSNGGQAAHDSIDVRVRRAG